MDPDATEYQTSNALYAALSATAADSNNRGVPIAFAGCYVIISTARPSISIKHRVGIIASELRTKLRLCKGHRGIEYVFIHLFVLYVSVALSINL